jgi:hypothetical protein
MRPGWGEPTFSDLLIGALRRFDCGVERLCQRSLPNRTRRLPGNSAPNPAQAASKK